MFTNQKTEKKTKNPYRIDMKLALLYFLLVIFFIFLLMAL